jgi:flagellin
MPQFINTNTMSLNAQRNLNSSQNALQTSLQRLSSGMRINSAADDAAGLAIADRMTSQIRGLNQAVRNANDGISVAQTAEGALQESSNILQRMRELAVQSANATNSATDRKALDAEVQQLKTELNRISNTTSFNGLNLLDGTYQNQGYQVGAESGASNRISVSIADTRNSAVGNNGNISENENTNAGTGSASVARAVATGANTIGAQTINIGSNIGQSGNISIAAGDSAAEIAASINSFAGSTGVTATAETSVNVQVTGGGTGDAVSFEIVTTDGSKTVFAAVASGDMTLLAAEVNKATGTTGVTASVDAAGTTMTLKHAQGADIGIQNYTNSTNAGNMTLQGTGDAAVTTLQGSVGSALDSSVVAGSLKFQSPNAFTISSSIVASVASAGSILDAAVANTGVASTLSAVSTVTIDSVANSLSALDIIDQALQGISDIRADLGAVQNRLSSTISNLSNISENTSASRSRIQDADFASETAQLSRNQILQQAGIAMLSQANAAPQNVLSLLQ